MTGSDWIGILLYIGYFLAAIVPLFLLKAAFKVPFEVTRKLYHLAIMGSIFPLMRLFSTWYAALLAVALFAVVLYPILKALEPTRLFGRLAVERAGGEFRESLIVVQISFALLIIVFWGILGEEWKSICIVAALAWGLGDASAALIGKSIGRHLIRHRGIEGPKTFEGTLAMYLVAGTALFLSLRFAAGQPWLLSLVIAALVAPISAVVELVSNRGLDTLTVPISTGLAVASYLALFASLGF